MTSLSLPMADATREVHALEGFVLIGNPNAGKTTLFNRLTGLRAHTSNFPGTTVEHREATIRLATRTVDLIDLPGLYSLDAVTEEERIACAAIRGDLPALARPLGIVLILDATHLERNLFLASQVLALRRPTLIALNQIDAARRDGIEMDLSLLQAELGCQVVALSARTGEGLDELRHAMAAMCEKTPEPVPEGSWSRCQHCQGCGYAARYDWARHVMDRTGASHGEASSRRTQAIDRILTHRVFGIAAFLGVMLLTFILIFAVAQYPMLLIENLFAIAGGAVEAVMPEGLLQSLLVDGVVAGVGGILVFLPQICLLFFLIALLEDSGYLARAAFVMDRLMRRFGLPGKAFVPMLAAHACAIPAIMATRVIEDRRERLVTMLVLPLMSCSARVPVYVMLIALLLPGQPVLAGLLFTGAYLLGLLAAVVAALVFRRTLLKGQTRPLIIELPTYRRPSLRNALLLTVDRAWVFIRNAGTVILILSMVLWALGTFPRMPEAQQEALFAQQVEQLQVSADFAGDAEAIERFASQRVAAATLEYSLLGHLGHAIEPVFRPLGYDWKISVGVLSSFAAREMVVSTLAVIEGLGSVDVDDEEGSGMLLATLERSTLPDGTPVFTAATCLSLLVFFVLAMQCLPTQVVTRRETGSWRWPLLQFGYMSVLAYTAALITYQVAVAMGLAA